MAAVTTLAQDEALNEVLAASDCGPPSGEARAHNLAVSVIIAF